MRDPGSELRRAALGFVLGIAYGLAAAAFARAEPASARRR